MKWIDAGMVLLSLAPASAATITISDQSKMLPDIAQTTTAILMNAGLPPRKAGQKSFVVEIKGFHCDRRANAALGFENPQSGLENDACRIDASNQKDTATGRKFGDGRTLLEVLDKIEAKDTRMHFTDCGMGYCGAFVKSLACTIRTDIEKFEGGGRWACTFVDDQ